MSRRFNPSLLTLKAGADRVETKAFARRAAGGGGRAGRAEDAGLLPATRAQRPTGSNIMLASNEDIMIDARIADAPASRALLEGWLTAS